MYVFSQGQIFIIFFILGLCIGIIFDIFRAFRKTVKIPDFITGIQDMIFMAIVGILIVNTLILTNHGQIRFYIIFAVLVGISFYFLTISKICMIILQEFMKICKKLLFFLFFSKKLWLKKKDFKLFCCII